MWRRYQDIRHTLLLATEPLLGIPRDAMNAVTLFALSKRPRRVADIGWTNTPGVTGAMVTRETWGDPVPTASASYIVKCLCITSVTNVRIPSGFSQTINIMSTSLCVSLETYHQPASQMCVSPEASRKPSTSCQHRYAYPLRLVASQPHNRAYP